MSYLPTCRERSSVKAALFSVTCTLGPMYLNPRVRRVLLSLLPVAFPAWAQVTVQEYPVPSGHRIHDVWADPAPNGPVYISAQGSGHLGVLDPKSGKVEFVA